MVDIEQGFEDLRGMNIPEAKEYIVHYITSLKLTEKQYHAVEEALATWNSRIQLARSKGADDLALEAEKEAEKLKVQQTVLAGEIGELRTQIEALRRQLPGLAAQERTIDPDLLEQELLIATGYLPGEDEKAQTDRRLKDMEKEATADAALAALKAKMGSTNSGGAS